MSLPNSPAPEKLRARPLEIGALLPLGTVSGVLLGALTNAVNGWLSPTYFLAFMSWQEPDDFHVWLRTVEQGVLEGSVYGTMVGVALMFYIGFITQLRAPLRLSLGALYRVSALSLAGWIMGGFNAGLLAVFVPQFYDSFIGLPAGTAAAIGFGWVSGSIWGAELGALLGLVFACAWFGRAWKQFKRNADERFELT